MTRFAAIGGGGTVAFLAVLLARPGDARLGLDAWLLFLGALALAALVERTRSRHPIAGRSLIESALRPRPERPVRPPELERIEREVALGVANAGDFHTRLRPLLRLIAGQLLAARGVSLDGHSERARELLGDETWELVRPDRERPRDAFAPGIEPERLREAAERLERIAR